VYNLGGFFMVIFDVFLQSLRQNLEFLSFFSEKTLQFSPAVKGARGDYPSFFAYLPLFFACWMKIFPAENQRYDKKSCFLAKKSVRIFG
jgi:hypothetical protein